MATTGRLRETAGRLLVDPRVWAGTLLLLCLYALNWFQVLAPPADLITVPALAVMFAYLYLTGVGLLFKWVAGTSGFWAGYALFTFAVTALGVWAVDRLRA